MSERFERAPQPIQNEPESENAEQHTVPEAALSPEAIEKIMEKVQDINSKDIAYTSIRRTDRIAEILEQGLLGTVTQQGFGAESEERNRKEEWAQASHGERNTTVHFNITGRSINTTPKNSYEGLELVGEIGKSEHMNKGGIAIIFDLTTFKEQEPSQWRHQGTSQKTKTFRVAGQDVLRNIRSRFDLNDPETGKPLSDQEHGFTLNHRVAPRFFKGLVVFVSISRKPTEKEIQRWLARDEAKTQASGSKIGMAWKEKNYREIDVENPDRNGSSPLIKKLAVEMQEVNKNNPERLLPIYDIFGNLLWPKQMSYEEVKKYVAERDKEKPFTAPVDTPNPNPIPVEEEGDRM